MEIKFRVWMLKSKQLIQPCYAEIFKDGSFSGGDNYLNSTECILMQFTGLKDKNGKDIYVGDILSSTLTKYKATVEYAAPSFVYRWEDGKVTTDRINCHYDIVDIEVIGNEFETPELIKDLQWK